MRKASLLTAWLLCLLSFPASASTVSVIRAEGVVNPVMAEFVVTHVDLAMQQGAGLLVIELDTPGGLDSSMRIIVKKILNSPVPVVVHVAPSGARAASAGMFITMAAHVAAMAPGTNIGAAHPVNISGGKMDDVMKGKVENDAAAYARSLADKRGRNADWAEKAVRESISAAESDALKNRVIDLVAANLDELLEKIHGRSVKTEGGEVVLETKGATVERHELSGRLKMLDIISNPNIAYLLMLAGIIGLYIELTNPGVIFPGVAGAICLILAFYALQTLPVNYAGILLIGLGILFFILEIKITSFGLLTIGGIIALVAGSILLFDSPLPFLRVSLAVIIPAVTVVSGFAILATTMAARAQKAPITTGMEGMIGLEGTALTDIVPGRSGQVSVHGEIWQARSVEPIPSGASVQTTEIRGLTLVVKIIP